LKIFSTIRYTKTPCEGKTKPDISYLKIQPGLKHSDSLKSSPGNNVIIVHVVSGDTQSHKPTNQHIMGNVNQS